MLVPIYETYIHTGDYKIDGNPTRLLPDDARVDIQAEVDTLYGMLNETVAINQGITEEAVSDTQTDRVFSNSSMRRAGWE